MATDVEARVVRLETIMQAVEALLRKQAQRLDDSEQKAKAVNPTSDPNAGTAGIFPASVTTAIPTGTLGSPSTSGRATIYRDNGSGGLTASEAGVVYNYHTLGASIAVGKTVSVYFRANVWWLVASDC